MFTQSATKDRRSAEPPTKMEIDKEITFSSPIIGSQRLHDSFLHLNRGVTIRREMCNCVTEEFTALQDKTLQQSDERRTF